MSLTTPAAPFVASSGLEGAIASSCQLPGKPQLILRILAEILRRCAGDSIIRTHYGIVELIACHVSWKLTFAESGKWVFLADFDNVACGARNKDPVSRSFLLYN